MERKHMSTLRKNYSAKRLQREKLLDEAIMDMFSSDSENVKKVTAALTRAKGVAGTYNMRNILAAVGQAEQQFQASIATKKTDPATNPTISNILTFSDVIADFFNQMDQWISQLPDMATAMEAADQPGNEKKTMKDLLGQKAPVITSIIQKQFDKSAGGFMKSIGRLFKTGRMTSAADALKAFGLDAQKAADDVLSVNAKQYKTLLQAAKQVQTPQIAAAPTPASSNTGQPTQPAQGAQTAQQSVPGEPTQQAQPSVTPVTTGPPSPEQAAARLQKLNASKPRFQAAFPPQAISQLSDDDIRTEMLKLANALGIKLT